MFIARWERFREIFTSKYKGRMKIDETFIIKRIAKKQIDLIAKNCREEYVDLIQGRTDKEYIVKKALEELSKQENIDKIVNWLELVWNVEEK